MGVVWRLAHTIRIGRDANKVHGTFFGAASGGIALISFCPYAFHHLMFEPSGAVRPCCRFDPSEALVVPASRDLSAFNSPHLQAIRKKMLSAEPIAGCRVCAIEESMQIPSMRQRAFNTDHLDTNSEVYLTSLELGVGRVCNLKCRTCDSRYSTKWDADDLALGRVPPGSSDDWLRDIKVDEHAFERVRAIKISGGEPLLSPSLMGFLQQLVALGLAKNIELQLYTNATLTPKPELLELLDSFGKIHLYLSVDGVGRVNEYLRHPAHWPAVEKVVAQWLAWKKERALVRCSLAHTLSTMNVLSFADFLEWRQLLEPRPDLTLQLVLGPRVLSLANVDMRTKTSIGLEFSAQKAEYLRKFSLEKSVERAFGKIEAMLIQPSSEPIRPSEFYIEICRVDELRGECFADVFPRVNAQLKNWVEGE